MEPNEAWLNTGTSPKWPLKELQFTSHLSFLPGFWSTPASWCVWIMWAWVCEVLTVMALLQMLLSGLTQWFVEKLRSRPRWVFSLTLKLLGLFQGEQREGLRMQRKSEFGVICHVGSVVSQMENIWGVRWEREETVFFSWLFIGKMCLTTNRDGNYRQRGWVAKYFWYSKI